MTDRVKIRYVSSVEPIFAVVDGNSVCTRTWEAGSDPKLNHREVVQLGPTVCQVIEKVTHSTKAGVYLVTYKFSPIDRHADLAAWSRLPDIPEATYVGHTEEGEQFPIITS